MTSAEIVNYIEVKLAEQRTSKTEFYAQTGISSAMFSNWRTGKNFPSMEALEAINDYLKTDFAITVEAQHPAIHPKPHPFTELYDAAEPQVQDAVLTLLRATQSARPAPRVQTIRHYLSRPAAGVDGLVEGEDYEDIPLPPNAPQNADYCVTISGHSMEPYLHDGELAFVDRDAPLNDFEVGVFEVDGALYIKQFVREYGGIVQLLSANREYDDITILPSGNQSFAYWGKVLTGKIPPPKA